MSVNARDFGAVGDGVTDDRAAIQHALDAGSGGLVWLDMGTYLLSKAPEGAWCLSVPAGTTLAGVSIPVAGTVLLQAPGIGANVRTLQAAAPGIAIETLTLDGNAKNQTHDEHRAGVFALGAVGLHIRDVIARNFTGDGIYVSLGSHDVHIERCTSTSNDRNGLTFGGGTQGGKVSSCHLFGNAVQQLDTEPGPGFTVDGVEVELCKIGPGRGDYAMTVAGSGAGWRSRGWRIHDNSIDGSLEMVWADDIEVNRNDCSNSTNKPTVQVYRACRGIEIRDNELRLLPPAAGAVADAIVAIVGTGADQMPDRVIVDRNDLISSAAPAHGVHITCAKTTIVTNNVIIGAGMPDPYASGVYARTTVEGAPMLAVVVHGNRIQNWGKFGISLAGNGAAVMQVASALNNIFIDDSLAGATMATAMSLPIARDVSVGGNTLLGGCAKELEAPPAGVNATMLGFQRWVV